MVLLADLNSFLGWGCLFFGLAVIGVWNAITSVAGWFSGGGVVQDVAKDAAASYAASWLEDWFS
jgi:hypothetical protein